jgi:hypothetical protein
MIKMLRGMSTAKNMVRSISATKDSPVDTVELMSANMSSAMIGGTVTYEIVMANARFSRSPSMASPSCTAVLLMPQRLNLWGWFDISQEHIATIHLSTCRSS